MWAEGVKASKGLTAYLYGHINRGDSHQLCSHMPSDEVTEQAARS